MLHAIWLVRCQVRSIPDLLRYGSYALGELLEGAEVRASISSGCDFLVPALAGEQRPGTARAPVLKRSAIMLLTIAIMVVTAPTGAERRIYLEHSIYNAK